MKLAKRRIGRPTKATEPGTRASLGLKVTAETKQRLEDAAQRSGRTQSQEAEHRLERSFEREDLLVDALKLAYGPELAGILLTIGAAMQGAVRDELLRTPQRKIVLWTDHPDAYEQAALAARRVLDAFRPDRADGAPSEKEKGPPGLGPTFFAERLLELLAGQRPAEMDKLDEMIWLKVGANLDPDPVRELLGPLLKRIKRGRREGKHHPTG